MSIVSWIDTAVFFAGAQAVEVAVWTLVGVMLLRAQESVTRTDLFVFVRMFGLKGATLRLAQMIAGHDFRMLTTPRYARSWQQVAASASVIPISAGMAAAVSVLMVLDLPAGNLPASRWLLPGAVIAGTSSIITATWLWLSGLGYVARASTRRRGSLPCLRIPGLTRQARDDLALRIYWYSGLKWTSLFAVVSVWAIRVQATWDGKGPPPGRHSPVDAYLGPALLTLSIIGPLVVALSVRRWLVFDRLAEGICSVLDAPAKAQPVRHGGLGGLIADPLNLWRADLAQLAAQLSETAWALDVRQVRGFTPHPVATLFRAASEHIRQFLRNQRSWTADIPDDLTELLRSAVVLVAMPGDPNSYQELCRRLSAFDGDGRPATEPGQRPPSRLATATRRATAGIAGAATTAVGIGTIAVFVIVWALFALHKMDISGVLGHMPP